jgi:hypothetical protein
VVGVRVVMMMLVWMDFKRGMMIVVVVVGSSKPRGCLGRCRRDAPDWSAPGPSSSMHLTSTTTNDDAEGEDEDEEEEGRVWVCVTQLLDVSPSNMNPMAPRSSLAGAAAAI